MSNVVLAGGAIESDGTTQSNVVAYSAATVALDPTVSGQWVFTGVNGALTLNGVNVTDGQSVKVIVVSAGVTSNNVTFGTNFKSTGVLATGTTAGKYFVVVFTSVNGTLVEVSRTAAQ